MRNDVTRGRDGARRALEVWEMHTKIATPRLMYARTAPKRTPTRTRRRTTRERARAHETSAERARRGEHAHRLRARARARRNSTKRPTGERGKKEQRAHNTAAAAARAEGRKKRRRRRDSARDFAMKAREGHVALTLRGRGGVGARRVWGRRSRWALRLSTPAPWRGGRPRGGRSSSPPASSAMCSSGTTLPSLVR